ncbi:hypothetical protein EB796_024462 [Bugula neritina]|uniref:Dynein heavy chain tail domain-containing protein n=1 Tax=Bugula neritina TaxID=10212 RepID=A0A7J7IUZ0_BUGNE|nr:hypothetical protein EB796_024462 [Bugula neritina]
MALGTPSDNFYRAEMGVHFSRVGDGFIPDATTTEEANVFMCRGLEMGTVNQNYISTLDSLLEHLFLPSLGYDSRRYSQAEQERLKKKEDGNHVVNTRDEFYSALMRLSGVMKQTSEQLEGTVTLSPPDLPCSISSVMEENLNNVALMTSIQATASSWFTNLSAALANQLQAEPKGKGPLAEISYWRERHANLSALDEQLKRGYVQDIIKVNSQVDNSLDYLRHDIHKYFLEAKDNARFLTTVDRHMKNITFGTTFALVTETIPNLMVALRMVWIISRYYNTDERMVPLLEKIAWQLCQRVKRIIDIKRLFQDPPEVVMEKCLKAKKMLETWKSSYFTTRAKIEESGRDSRWEFDRKRLFDRTDYMSSICGDLANVAKTLHEFHSIFTSDLKNVTGEVKLIGDILAKVDNLKSPIINFRESPFDKVNTSAWNRIMEWFSYEVNNIEQETINFINESFKKLRSAEAAYDLFHKFKNIRSRKSINEEMMKRFNDILLQFSKEVERVERIYREKKKAPPVSKSDPPVVGAIRWARMLLHKMKDTVLKLAGMPEFLHTDTGRKARGKYLYAGRSLKAYEESKYHAWVDHAEHVVAALLKKSLIVKASSRTSSVYMEREAFERVCKLVSGNRNLYRYGRMSIAETDGEQNLSYRSHAKNAKGVLIDMRVRYLVNFDSELLEIACEARSLEHLGYHIPVLTRNLALQIDKYLGAQYKLQLMVDRYHLLLDSLNVAEIKLLDHHLKELRRIMKPGISRLNWYTLGITEFATKCMHEYFEELSQNRSYTLRRLVTTYRAMSPMLTKIEGLVVNTNTGKACKLAPYYQYWEEIVYDTIRQVCCC